MLKNQTTALAAELETVDCDLCGSGKKTPYLEAPDHNWPIQSNHLGELGSPAAWSLVQCQDCGLVYLNPRPAARHLEKHYPPGYYAFDSGPVREGSRLKELHPNSPVLAASLVLIQRRCGRPGCHCQKGKGHPTHYLTCKQKGKTRSVHVPKQLVPEVQQWIREHKRIKPLLRHISQLALAQIQTHSKAQRRKAGRS